MAVNVSEALQTANVHHQAGRLLEADAVCRQILEVSPTHPDALHLLGMIAYEIGMHDVAETFLRHALASAPNFADGHNNLGVVLMAQGKLEGAAASYQKAIALQPTLANAHYNLGNIFKDQGKTAQATASYQKAIALQPDYAKALNNLGDVLHAQGKLSEAVSCYLKALRINPDLADVHFNLGVAYQELGRLEESVISHRLAIKINPDYAEAHCNLGNVLRSLGRLDEAVACGRRALVLKPDDADAHLNLGNVLTSQGLYDDALACYREAIKVKPDFTPAYCNMGNAHLFSGRLDEAVACSRQALSIKPDDPEALASLGNALQAQGLLEDALLSYRRALSMKPDWALVHSNLLYSMQYMAALTPADIFSEHRRYAEHFESPKRAQWGVHTNTRDPDRRLKIGYVSGDFRNHAVAFFIEPILASHDKARVETFCYYSHTQHDSHTDRIAGHVDHWLACVGLSDEQLVERIQTDGIDILVDLSGHTGHNRLPVFACKPAPVQATWIGYPGSTGLTAIDYRITDAYMDPPGLTEHYHSEELIRLPETGAAFRSEPGCPPVNALPALSAGELVFACLNNVIKINSAVIALWARLLVALPNSRLMLGNVTDDGIRRRLIDGFANAGIGAERLILQPRMPIADYLALHHQIDVALDPFPYNGGTTTMHSLWMGVPVITLAGQHPAARAGVASLSRVGLDEFITHNEEAYVQRALQLAQDLPGLNRIRQSLRERMCAVNCDSGSITGHLEAAYREMWRKWCAI